MALAKAPLPAGRANVIVNPSLTTLVDQKVDIIVSNLSPEQNITLQARTIDDSNVVFESLAYYMANKNGEVLVSSQPSLGGSYTGVEPMGLFWSMKPVTELCRDDLLRKRDVTTPLKVTINVYSSIQCQGGVEERDKEASITLERCYMGVEVIRRFVDDSGFYGTLFLPPGDGPFAGVIDLWGRTGGIREDRAALLASNGFAVLALAFCGYKDLCEKYGVLDFIYFEKAVDWLTAHTKVKSDGVALVGLSLGGALALGIASQIPNKIKGVVSISGTPVLIGCSLKCRNMTIPGYPVDLVAPDYAQYSNFLSIFKSKKSCKPGSASMVPVENVTCPVLLVYGLADKLNPEIEWMCEQTFQHMEKHGKGSLCKRLGLSGAGHFLTPCYLPPSTRQYAPKYDDEWFLGGEKHTQAKASEIYWKESLEFLRKCCLHS